MQFSCCVYVVKTATHWTTLTWFYRCRMAGARVDESLFPAVNTNENLPSLVRRKVSMQFQCRRGDWEWTHPAFCSSLNSVVLITVISFYVAYCKWPFLCICTVGQFLGACYMWNVRLFLVLTNIKVEFLAHCADHLRLRASVSSVQGHLFLAQCCCIIFRLCLGWCTNCGSLHLILTHV